MYLHNPQHLELQLPVWSLAVRQGYVINVFANTLKHIYSSNREIAKH